MNFELNKIVRKNILELEAYSSARSEYKGKQGIFLDANENTLGSPTRENYNRYPDPLQLDLKEKISRIKGLPIQNIFLGNGSDEAIDLLFRIFCNPSKDNVIICPPTYGMYEVSANINDVGVKKVSLIPETFQLDVKGVLDAIDECTKLIFFCCPNNPTGTSVAWKDIKAVLEEFKGIVVVDEAYINYASYRSLIPELLNYPNLVIMQTFSKAWGMAALRVGMAFASEPIIDLFNKIKPPYNINAYSQETLTLALDQLDLVNARIKETVKERERLKLILEEMTMVTKVYPSEANFLLVKFSDAPKVFNYLIMKCIIVRDRSRVQLCEGCLRITIGTVTENDELIKALKEYKS